MTLLYFLPILVAVAFVLAHVARGGKLNRRPDSRWIATGIAAVLAVALIGALASGFLR
jgi:hypothetical protein